MGADAVKLRVITLAAVLPDIDIVSIFLGTEAARNFHGTLMHSVFVVPIMAAVLALVVQAVWRQRVILWALAGVYLHLVLDVANVPSYASDATYNPFRPLDVNLRPALDPTVALVLWIVAFGTLFVVALVWLVLLARAGEPPWKVWLDVLWPRKKAE